MSRRVLVGGLAVVGVAHGGGRHARSEPLVAENDRRISAQRVTLAGASGPLAAYWVRLASARAKPPAVLLIHESRGLVDYPRDVARRLAVSGMACLAPDLLSPQGGTPAGTEEAKARWDRLVTDQVVADAVACLAWLSAREECSGKLGAVGFAWGGNIVGRLAAVAPTLDGAVIFYGKPPPESDAARIRVPMQVHLAALDTKSAEAEPAFEETLKARGSPVEAYRYANVAASFHNDASTRRFNAEAAQLAWDRTLGFLKGKLA